MMSTAKSLLVIAVVSAILLSQGTKHIVAGQSSDRCSKDDLLIQQEKTGVLIQGKPEFKVTVLNSCPCTQGQIRLNCDGFQTIEKIDPAQMTISGKDCLLGNGAIVAPFAAVPFTYAWNGEFQFKPISSSITC